MNFNHTDQLVDAHFDPKLQIDKLQRLLRMTAAGSVATIGLFAAQLAFSAVGATRGEADVSSNGTAQYNIPIWVPSGTATHTPSVSITYDSARQNGLTGIGFALGGFSAITRCTKTIAQDGSNGAVAKVQGDKYCLDGQKLRLVSGTYGSSGSEYRTEIDAISKITASGSAGGAGPQSFTVRRKSGLDYEYGTTSTSRIEFVSSSIVRSWALSKVKDRSGNVIEYTYIEDGTNGGYRPDEIRYTTNPGEGVSTAPYVVKFVYETSNRPDPIYDYVAGSPAHEFKRLERIEIKHNGSIERQYLLTYELGDSDRSRLESLEECAATTGDCLSSTEFTWTDSVASFGSESDSGSNIPIGYRTWHLMDVNGDGRDDLVYVSSTSGGGTWRIRKLTRRAVSVRKSIPASQIQTISRRSRLNGTATANSISPCPTRAIIGTSFDPTAVDSIHPTTPTSQQLARRTIRGFSILMETGGMILFASAQVALRLSMFATGAPRILDRSQPSGRRELQILRFRADSTITKTSIAQVSAGQM